MRRKEQFLSRYDFYCLQQTQASPPYIFLLIKRTLQCCYYISWYAIARSAIGPAPQAVTLMLQMLQTIKLQTDPEVILISSTAEGAFQEACRQPIVVAGETEGTFSLKLERPSLFLHNKVSIMSHLLSMPLIQAKGCTVLVRCIMAQECALCVRDSWLVIEGARTPTKRLDTSTGAGLAFKSSKSPCYSDWCQPAISLQLQQQIPYSISCTRDKVCYMFCRLYQP